MTIPPLLPAPRRLLTLLAGAVLLSAFRPTASAQTPTPRLVPAKVAFDFYARGPYRAEIPRPAALLGYEPGEFHTDYANYERVLREIAARSDRLRVFTLGQTAERRPLYLLAVSTPENLARLDAIKSDLARLADPRGCSDAEAAAIAARSPLVVWLSYSIHGDESAAFEAGMQVLYQLTASEDPGLVATLANCVVLINPAQNPDGHERFVTWYNAVGLGRPEPFAFEHRQPWSIAGRFNHYRFDLNRDLLPGSQTESRAAMAAFLDWHPQVNADHHGETKNFFFPPPALPVNQALPPAETSRWQDLFGQANAAAFDRYHWLYYSRDVYDLYYPGYWDSWPSLHGSIGMTFETDGGGKRGLNWQRDDHTFETLREAIAKHFTASLTTLETSAWHREERLRDFHRFFSTAMAEAAGAKDGVRQVAISPGKDPGRTAALVANLLRQGIEVRRVNDRFTLANARPYLPSENAATTPGPRDFPAGSYLVDLAQPQGRIARTLLSPDAPLDPEFARRQIERQARNLQRGRHEPEERPQFYDVTAWSLPLVFHVEAAFSPDAPAAGAGEFVRRVDAGGVTVSDRPGPGGAERVVTFVPPPPATVTPAATAYAWTPESEAAYRLSFKLLQEGYHLATATEPVRAGGRDFPRGTLLARVERNPESLHARVAGLAAELGVSVVRVDSAFLDRGTVGPGSEAVISLKVPKVALIADDAVTQTSYGEIAYLLGQDFGVEFVPMTIAAFKQTRMADFNVLILPDGKAKGIAEAFGKSGVDKLKGWCRQGGTLLCVGGAAGFAADKKINLSSARVVAADLLADDDDEQSDAGPAAPEKPGAEEERRPEGRKAEPPTPAPADNSAPEDNPKKSPSPGAPAAAGEPKRDGGKNAPDNPADGPTRGYDRRKIPLPVPGAIMRAQVNRHHFLTIGYEEDLLPVLVDTDQFLLPSKAGANVLTFAPVPGPGEKTPPVPLRLAGFIWPDNTERLLRGTAAVIEEPLGDGHVILTANGPSFRLLWRASTRLWLNGLLYAPSLGGSPGRG